MRTVEIPQTEWPQFFRNFTALHRGWGCTMEVLGASLGAQIQSSGMGLEGIDADLAPVPQITVALGDQPAAHLTHTIDTPEHVWLLQSDSNDDEVLEIESHDLRTLLRFRAGAQAAT